MVALSRCQLWCAVLPGETILQTSVPELIYRADCSKDAALSGIVEKSHESDWRMPASDELSSGE
jgi:hypothetical protein